MTEPITPTAIREIREALEQSQREFGETLWQAIHGPRRNGELPYTRSYVSKLERGRKPITIVITRGILAIATRMDGIDEIQARAREVDGLLAINDLPDGTVILGRARRCANPGCPVVFVPTHPRQKYHSPACRAQARARRKSRRH